MTRTEAAARLEEIREEIQAERISYGELSELQDLTPYIDDSDVELLEWAGVAEYDDIEWEPVAGIHRGPHYVEGQYRGMHCELFLNTRLGSDVEAWDWSFYDDKSPEPDLAVARNDVGFLSRRACVTDLTRYIDDHLG